MTPQLYVNCISLNQDASAFICGTSKGFRVFTSNPLEEIIRREPLVPSDASVPQPGEGERKHDGIDVCDRGVVAVSGSGGTPDLERLREGEEVFLAAMLFRTNLFALITSPNLKTLRIWDDANEAFLGFLKFRHRVKAIGLGRDLLCVSTESAVYLYGCEKLKPLDVIQTIYNPLGLMKVQSSESGWKMCCLGLSIGSIRLLHSVNSCHHSSFVIEAHTSPLRVIALSMNGEYVGTYSESGSCVKIFSTSNGILQYHISQVISNVSSFIFNQETTFILISSKSGRIHLLPCTVSSSPINHVLQSVLPRRLWKRQGMIFRTPKNEHLLDLRRYHSGGSSVICGFLDADKFFAVSFKGVFSRLKIENKSIAFLDATTWISSRPGFVLQHQKHSREEPETSLANNDSNSHSLEDWEILS